MYVLPLCARYFWEVYAGGIPAAPYIKAMQSQLLKLERYEIYKYSNNCGGMVE